MSLLRDDDELLDGDGGAAESIPNARAADPQGRQPSHESLEMSSLPTNLEVFQFKILFSFFLNLIVCPRFSSFFFVFVSMCPKFYSSTFLTCP